MARLYRVKGDFKYPVSYEADTAGYDIRERLDDASVNRVVSANSPEEALDKSVEYFCNPAERVHRWQSFEVKLFTNRCPQ